MSDTEEQTAEQLLLEKHRSEKKLLSGKFVVLFASFSWPIVTCSAQIAKLRHSVGKNDKKKKKEINDEIERLENDLKKKQTQELDAFVHTEIADSNTTPSNNGDDFKASKSYRRRENKERKEKDRQERIRLGQIDDSENIRLIEMKKIEDLLLLRGLSLCEISSDGDCMYKAIEHQLRLTRGIFKSVDELRRLACNYIRQHKDDFLPFLILNDDSEIVSDEEFEIYCNKIANTKTWGGNLELKALSNVLKVPIEIIQAEGSSIQIGFSDFGMSNPLILWFVDYRWVIELLINICFFAATSDLPINLVSIIIVLCPARTLRKRIETGTATIRNESHSPLNKLFMSTFVTQ